jgi:hypothetical protein
MKRLLLLIAVVGLSASVYAQKAKKTKKAKVPVKGTWTKTIDLYGGLTQVGNNNWYSTGSDKFTMSLMGQLNATAGYSWKNKTWGTGLYAAYGLLNTTHTGVTKLNDRFEIGTRLLINPKQWNKKWAWGPRAALRTQFSNGYFYNYMGDENVNRRRSGFFAPAIITVSPIGLYHKPCKAFEVYASPLTARWIVVTNQPYSYMAQGGVYKGVVEDPLARLYNVSPTKEHRGEFGLYARFAANFNIMKNISYSGRAEIFGNYLTAYKDALPGRFANMDIFMVNQVKMKVNKLIDVRYNLDVMYDDDMKQPGNAVLAPRRSVGLQMLSTLGVGVSFNR